MKYKPLMMMRIRGLYGPIFGKHKGTKKLTKSTGAQYSAKIKPPTP